MIVMSSTEVRQNFGEFLNKGSRQTIVIKRQNREVGAFVPIADLKKLQKIRAQELDKMAETLSSEGKKNGFTESILNEILNEVNPS